MWMFSLMALSVGLVLAGLWWLTGRVRANRTHHLALLWLAYAGYEALMAARVLCSGDCNIRIDLLLLWPVLMLATLAWLAVAVGRAWRRGQRR